MPLALIPNSVETEKISAQFRAASREVFAPSALCIATAIWSKGSDITVAAIKRARLYYPELKVIAFGTGYPPREFLPPRTQFYLRAKVADDELVSLYSSCDAWLDSEHG